MRHGYYNQTVHMHQTVMRAQPLSSEQSGRRNWTVSDCESHVGSSCHAGCLWEIKRIKKNKSACEQGAWAKVGGSFTACGGVGLTQGGGGGASEGAPPLPRATPVL